jgi:hypothetical protein
MYGRKTKRTQALVEKLSGKGRTGKLRYIWKAIIKMDLK